jgi:hypothetical protein
MIKESFGNVWNVLLYVFSLLREFAGEPWFWLLTVALVALGLCKLIPALRVNSDGDTSAKPTKKCRTITIKSKWLTDGMINLLVVGRTGSGKSYFLALILYLFAKYRNANITICDFKKSSFAHFDKAPNFCGYEECPDGIREFYEEFEARLQANDTERNKQIKVLLIDEFGALISSRERKEADELKTMVANMLFMGRSLGIVVIIGIQRADSEYFKAGARDQFMAILALSNLSKEQKNMLFSEYKEEMTAKNGRGQGYLLIDGQGVERVKIAKIKDFDRLNDVIETNMYNWR